MFELREFCLFQPHRKKKAFIEKKKAVTFHLVHRSQRDPLAADEKAPQHVLLPANKVLLALPHRNMDVFINNCHLCLRFTLRETFRGHFLSGVCCVPQVEVEKRHEEQRSFGVFFDDDYDYLQHLKEASGQTELVASVPSFTERQIQLHDDEEYEEEEGDGSTMAPVSHSET